MNGYTDPETDYDADDIPEQGQMGLDELRVAIQSGLYRPTDNIYHIAGVYSVSSDVLIALDWIDTVAGFCKRWSL